MVVKLPWIKFWSDDELYWRLGTLSKTLHCSNWREFFEYAADLLEKKLEPLYIDEKGMLSLILAFAIWRRIEEFTAKDWEMLSDVNVLKNFVETGVSKILGILGKMSEKEKIELAKTIQKKIEILYKMFEVLGEVLDKINVHEF